MTEPSFSVILLAGGCGSRMQAEKPKQFLSLGDRCIALYSLDLLKAMPETREIIVVCDPLFRHYFAKYQGLKWALPGARRQDSVYNGLQQILPEAEYVCVHDACRPFIDEKLVRRVFAAAQECGAAAAGMPIKFTVKEVNHLGLVMKTPDRAFFWEIQTPQIVRKKILNDGFIKALAHSLSVTDDTSLAELVGSAVKLVEGAYSNIKITTPEDLAMAHTLVKSHG